MRVPLPVVRENSSLRSNIVWHGPRLAPCLGPIPSSVDDKRPSPVLTAAAVQGSQAREIGLREVRTAEDAVGAVLPAKNPAAAAAAMASPLTQRHSAGDDPEIVPPIRPATPSIRHHRT